MISLQGRSKVQKSCALYGYHGIPQTSSRTSSVTWPAIDYLAARGGIRWQDWASRGIHTNLETNNMAAEQRQAAIQQLLDTIGQGSNEVVFPDYHPILGNAYNRVDDATLAKVLVAAFILHRDDSFVSFGIIISFLGDEEGSPSYAFRNASRVRPACLLQSKAVEGLCDA